MDQWLQKSKKKFPWLLKSSCNFPKFSGSFHKKHNSSDDHHFSKQLFAIPVKFCLDLWSEARVFHVVFDPLGVARFVIVKNWLGRNRFVEKSAERFPSIFHIPNQKTLWWNNGLNEGIVFFIFNSCSRIKLKKHFEKPYPARHSLIKLAKDVKGDTKFSQTLWK